MILIPKGVATIGAENFPYGEENALPLEKRHVAGFYIDKTEVTNADYEKCIKARQCLPVMNADHIEGYKQGDRPVLITYHQALRYCLWQGKRLPTEIEWEKAARGENGRKYPWGDQKPDVTRGNICDINCFQEYRLKDWNDNHAYTSPVGSFPGGNTPEGLTDMAGNVKEWVKSDRKPGGNHFIAKGASWYSHTGEMESCYRQVWYPGVRLDDKGVRCAASMK